MHKIISFVRKIPLKIYILFILIAIIVPTVNFLNSIHYKLGGYLEFMWDYRPIQNFDDHKEAFETLVNDIENFVNNTPDFYNQFTGELEFKDNSLFFVRKGKNYTDPDFEYKYALQDADKIQHYGTVFPENFSYGVIQIDSKYPGYVMFCGDETSCRVLVYTGGKKPSKLIDSFWEKFNFVCVHKVAKGWYDIAPGHNSSKWLTH